MPYDTDELHGTNALSLAPGGLRRISPDKLGKASIAPTSTSSASFAEECKAFAQALKKRTIKEQQESVPGTGLMQSKK